MNTKEGTAYVVVDEDQAGRQPVGEPADAETVLGQAGTQGLAAPAAYTRCGRGRAPATSRPRTARPAGLTPC
jgi:hypothetical protein